MTAFSDYLEAKILDHVLRATSYPLPAGVYVALYTDSPNDDNSGTEVAQGGYSRQNVTSWTSIGVGGATENTTAITWSSATTSWGTITHIGILDAANNGNLLFHGGLTANKTVSDGDTFKINAGDLDITLA